MSKYNKVDYKVLGVGLFSSRSYFEYLKDYEKDYDIDPCSLEYNTFIDGDVINCSASVAVDEEIRTVCFTILNENGKAYFLKNKMICSRCYDLIRDLFGEGVDPFDTIDEDEEFFDTILTLIEEQL